MMYVLGWCIGLVWSIPVQYTSPVHTTHQPSIYNSPVQYIQHTSPVHTTLQSSTYNTPVQYIQHTSPVHTTHQSSTYNTPVQYIQHTSPVHTSHQSSTYNTPVQYIQHMDGWIPSKIKNGVAIIPENRKDVGCLAWKICGFEIDASL